MYLTHFQLSAKPFQITSDPKFLWLGEKHREALATLRYGIMDNRGFLLLTGEVGTGKTLLINRLLTLLNQDTIVATLPDPDLEGLDFFNTLAAEFKMNRTFESKGPFLIQLRDFLQQAHAKQKQVLLIIDECQRLKQNLMEDIRMLSNMELHDRKLINIFFVGQLEFNNYLASPANRALAQRITVRYNIAPLEKEEISKYIFHRLQVAGCTRKLFSNGAIEQIFEFSNGIPRLINIICDHALLTAYARGAKQVEEQVIRECAEELNIPFHLGKEEKPRLHDSKSIAEAARTARMMPDTGRALERKSEDHLKPSGASASGRPANSFWRTLMYAGILCALILTAGFAVIFMDGGNKIPWQKWISGPHELQAPVYQPIQRPSQNHGGKRDVNEETPPAAAADRAGENLGAEPDASLKKTGGLTGAPARENKTVGLQTSPVASAQTSPVELSEVPTPPFIKQKMVIPFGHNSSEVDNSSFKMLDQLAIYLIAHRNERIYLRGFTDSSGSPGYNESISRFRTTVVKSYLVGKGVLSEQVETFAMGNAQPISSNDTAEGRNMNRRVEIEFKTGKGNLP